MGSSLSIMMSIIKAISVNKILLINNSLCPLCL
jgi:hypothetical protein